MPSHCSNRLIMVGTKEERDSVLSFMYTSRYNPDSETINETVFDLNKIRPCPDSLGEDPDWCAENWGTKWGAYDVGVFEDEKNMTTTVCFLTAWCPVLRELFVELFAKYPSIGWRVQYAEQGMGFLGEYSETADSHVVLRDEHFVDCDERETLIEKFSDWQELYNTSG